MAKLIKILAASLGGGLVLGAGIRMGEAFIGGDLLVRQDKEIEGKLAARLGSLENRLRSLEVEQPGSRSGGSSSPASNIEQQAAEVASIRSQLNIGDRELEALNEISLRLRGELRSWLEESVGTRMADVETKLRAESERSQRQMLDVFVESVQTRVTHRISRLEEEVAGQSVAMTELRECSMRTEQSMQKLLGGLDRLIVAQPPAPVDTASREEQPAQNPNAAGGDTTVDSGISTPAKEPESAAEAQPEAESKPPEDPRPRPRRWRIFG